MADVVDKVTRSRMMSGIRGKNTAPELAVRRFLHGRGFRFRLHVRELPGRPDIVLRRYGAAIHVHGCFWHRHQGCRFAVMPSSNSAFWKEKLGGNARRDRKRDKSLTALGWHTYTIWECEVKDGRALRKLDRWLRTRADRA